MDKSIALTALALMFISPVVLAQTAAPSRGIDPNTFIVGHPASPTWKAGHSNAEHPAVLVAARPAATHPDSNRFLVQPPASVRWTTQPQPLVLAGVPR